jgi:hypothetical protein
VAKAIPGHSRLTQPAPKDRFPHEGIETTAAYQLMPDELLLDFERILYSEKII